MRNIPLKILVCVKQVPDTTELKIDPVTNNLRREGVAGVVNPYDAYALEAAARIKDEHPDTRITVISMGPPQAERALRQCLAAGADDAYLASGKAFGGSDTLATSYILSRAIRCVEARHGSFDLVLCGRQAVDGDTAQTGPQIAAHLDVPQVTLVKEIRLRERTLLAVRETEHGTELWETPLPAVITVTKPDFEPRCPTVGAKLAAKRAAVNLLTMDDIQAEPGRCGAKGSATVVRKTFAPAVKATCVFARDAAGFAELLWPHLNAGGAPERAAPIAPTACFDTADVWVWIENPSGAAELLSCGRRIANLLRTGLTAVMLGTAIEDAVNAVRGADRVIYVDDPALAAYNAEPYTAALHCLTRKYGPDTMLFAASCNGRDLAPRLACLLRTGLTADCTGLDADPRTGQVQWIRPAFSGNLMAVVECRARPQMGTLRLAGTVAGGTAEAKEIIREQMDLPGPRARLLERHDETDESGSLADAGIIVSGGRGVGGAERFSLLRELAWAMGGTVAGSRAAADAGWLPRAYQVGQSGRMVCPKLYVACGISGAAQHLAGISGAEIVAAVNSDPDAPIFGTADYGIVGDIREVLPALTEEIRRTRESIL